jgi:hypothetical protein
MDAREDMQRSSEEKLRLVGVIHIVALVRTSGSRNGKK